MGGGAYFNLRASGNPYSYRSVDRKWSDCDNSAVGVYDEICMMGVFVSLIGQLSTGRGNQTEVRKQLEQRA